MNARRVAATLTLLALPFGLAACGGSSKPSKADVKAGMQKSIDKKLAENGSKAAAGDMSKKLTDCVVDKTYDKLSNKALNALKDGEDDAKVESGDKSTMDKALKECMTSVTSSS